MWIAGHRAHAAAAKRSEQPPFQAAEQVCLSHVGDQD